MKLRPIEAAEKATESVKRKARGKLLDWLPHHACEDCGAICEATTEYVESQAMYMPVWKCECGKRYYREDENPVTASMWD